MSVSSGPSIVTNGLIVNLDASNRKSVIDAAPLSLINTSAWAAGQTGTVGIYAANESANTENARVANTDPWGVSSVVWETRTTGDNNADGGWNTNQVSVDRTKLHRFSVWVRRTSSTASGTFYLGLYTNGTNNTILLDNTTSTNFYWDYRAVSGLTQNQWYLVTAHIFPAGHTGTTAHPDSGIYTIPNGTIKVAANAGTNGNDVKFPTDATAVQHRTYHYYSTDATVRMQFAYPRIDVCDGNQPSIRELLDSSPRHIKNIIGSSYKAYMNSQSAISGGVLTTATGVYAQITDLNLATGTHTIMGASRYSGATRGRIISSVNNNWLLGHYSSSTENYYAEGWVTFAGATGTNDTVWRIQTATGDSVGDAWKNYVNGALKSSGAGGSAGPNNIQLGGYGGANEPSDGQVGFLLVYNRVLTDAEIQQNFNALRSRYSI